MEKSIRYDRITRYFGSSIFLVINNALKNFIQSKGKIRIICSPILKDEDIEAIYKGHLDKIESDLKVQMNQVIEELEKEYPNHTDILAKLITMDVLQIKLAVFREDTEYYRLMHDKAGVFTDDHGNAVAFRGSINETFKGISEFGNSESFDVFTNWENEKDTERVNIVIDQFEKMWSNKEPKIKTFDLPNESMEKLKSYSTNKTLSQLYEEINIELYQKNEEWYADLGDSPRIVRKHQEQALNNWKYNSRSGILEMSTGS